MLPLESLRKYLLYAAADGNLERLMKLLERKDFDKKLMMRGPFGSLETPIYVAVVHGHSHIVEAIVKYYTEATSREAGFPMRAACMKGTADCVRIIFKSLPHLRNTMDGLGYYLIHMAASRGRNDIVEVLLELGVDVNQTTWCHDHGSACKTYLTRKTALDIALEEGWPDVVQTLLKYGADPLKPSFECGRSALSRAASSGHFNILHILSQVIPLDQDYGSHAVWSAAEGMNLTCLEYLLDNGATFNLEDKDRIMSVWRVIINNRFRKPDFKRIRIIEILLENGVPMNPLAAKSFLLRLSEFMTKPILKFLNASGLFEMMYSKVYQTLDSNHCEKFSSEIFRLFSEWHPSYDPHKEVLQYTADKLRSFIPYLPYSFISAQRYFDKEFIDDHFRDENLKKFPSLQELCRWKIRCQILSKQGYISLKLLSKLGLPKPLQEYLFDKVSHNLNWRLRVEDQESWSNFSSNAAG